LHQVEKDKLILKIAAARSGKPWDEIDNTDNMQVIYSLQSYRNFLFLSWSCIHFFL